MKILLTSIKYLLVALFAGWLITYLALRFEQHEYLQLTPEQLQQAEQYLEGKLTPTPATWQWQDYFPEPDVRLRTGMIDTPNAKGTVIVVPGFTATVEMLMREIVAFHQAGYRVASLEYRGQGESWRPLPNPEKGYVQNYSQLGSELASFAQSHRIEGKPLFFYSVSKGAHITVRMAGEQNVGATAYALIVPLIKLNTGDFDYSLMRRVVSVFHSLGLGSMYGPGQLHWPNGELTFGKSEPCNSNPETAQTREAIFALRETSRTNGVTMSWLHRTANSSELINSEKHMSEIQQPVKMITAGVDSLVNSDAAQAFCKRLKNCEYTHFDDARHCITREDFDLYDGILQNTIAFFNRNSG